MIIQSIEWKTMDKFRHGATQECLVFDAILDDVVLAIPFGGGESTGKTRWMEMTMGLTLPKPLFWAEKPYPVRPVGEKQ